MASQVELRGLENLARLTHALRDAGEAGKGLRREFRKTISDETKDIRAQMRAGMKAGAALPSRGGMAADVQSKTTFTTSITSTGVRIRVRSKRSIRRMNATGTFRHPVFGNRKVWVTQTVGVEKGFLDKPFEKARPAVRDAVLLAIARTRADIYRRI